MIQRREAIGAESDAPTTLPQRLKLKRSHSLGCNTATILVSVRVPWRGFTFFNGAITPLKLRPGTRISLNDRAEFGGAHEIDPRRGANTLAQGNALGTGAP